MGIDLLLPVRKAVIRELRAYGPLAALVEDRCYDEVPGSPKRPYVTYGAPIVTSLEATGIGNGAEIEINIHVFDQSHDNDRLYEIMNEVRNALDEAEIDVVGGDVLWLQWTGVTLAPEDAGTPKYRHALVTFTHAVGELES